MYYEVTGPFQVSTYTYKDVVLEADSFNQSWPWENNAHVVKYRILINDRQYIFTIMNAVRPLFTSAHRKKAPRHCSSHKNEFNVTLI